MSEILESQLLNSEFNIKSFLENLTSRPGIYRMLDDKNQILYIGKARNLKKRVNSYFNKFDDGSSKTIVMVNQIARIEITVTHTETEALLLENNLIKEYKPKYNILFKDDKSYPYIYLSSHQHYPRLSFYRGPRKGKGQYFGPFSSSGATRATLAQIQKLFKVRQCKDSFFNNRTRPCLQYQIHRCTAPCVGHISEQEYAQDITHIRMFLSGHNDDMLEQLQSQMQQASDTLDFENAAKYRDLIKSLRAVQEKQYISKGKSNIDVLAASTKKGLGLIAHMVIRNGRNLGVRIVQPKNTKNTKNANAEDLLLAFLTQHYLSKRDRSELPEEIILSHGVSDSPWVVSAVQQKLGLKMKIRIRVRAAAARWLKMAQENVDVAVEQKLTSKATVEKRMRALSGSLGLTEEESIKRIECFDISHTQGEATIASCVVFEQDGACKQDYRRYNIKSVTNDDFAAMEEALTRRYERIQKEEGKLPDIVLIDGGKGQLSRAAKVFEELQIDSVVLLGIAKGPGRKSGTETLFLYKDDNMDVIETRPEAFILLQQIRDEAHRFAITGHRLRRQKSRRVSILDEIEGIGAVRKKKLLHSFGGLQALGRAGIEDIARVDGISYALAEKIYNALQEAN